MHDNITEVALNIIRDAGEPLETKEIQGRLEEEIKNVTRTKLFYRLTNLRGDGIIKGKFVGPGKGVWIWWVKELFADDKNTKGEKEW